MIPAEATTGPQACCHLKPPTAKESRGNEFGNLNLLNLNFRKLNFSHEEHFLYSLDPTSTGTGWHESHRSAFL